MENTLSKLLRESKNFAQSASNSVASNVSAPVDGLAWLLKKAGVPMPTNPMGGSDWMAEKGLTRPVNQNSLSGLLGEFAGLAGPMVAAGKAPQIAGGLLGMADNLAAPRTMNPQTGAVVWHGSPHKFDKFDSAKIGTGEGNQAYGHGLYLADSPDVAKGYATNLAMRDSGQTPAQINAAIKQTMDTMQGPRRAQVLAGLRADLEMAKQTSRAGPQTYKVDLPDEHIAKTLDWDKPLSGQSAEVQKAIKDYDALGGKGVYHPDATGSQVYNRIGDKADGKDAAEMLRWSGIPGIRYLDGGSRATGGTSNYVVFPGNEGLLNIMERNGQKLR